MNYDRIILELMNRVQLLEEKVLTHDDWIHSRNDNDEETEEIEDNTKGSYTRKQAREMVIDIIQRKFPNYLVTTASRKEGSGIKITKPDLKYKRPILIKFYHSRSFTHKSGENEHGWHVTKLTDVVGTNVDYCLYSMVDSNDTWSFFIFESEQIGQYHDENRADDGNALHLYFSVQNGTAKELREGTIDVTSYLNNWEKLK